MRTASRLWPIFLSVAELADAMGVSWRYVYDMIRNGLPLYQLGTNRKIATADVVEYGRKHFKHAKTKQRRVFQCRR